MNSMFSNLGILLMIVAVVWGVMIFLSAPVFTGQTIGKFKKQLIIFAIGFLSWFVIDNLYVYASPGYSYLIQYPSGKQVAVLTPGFHPLWFGNWIEMKKTVTVKLTSNKKALNDKDGDKKVASSTETPYKVRFVDAVEADVEGVFRFKMPEKPEAFIKLATEYRDQNNIIGGLLVPAINETLRNSARLISAQDYIAGKGGAFESAITDQLQSGIYNISVDEVVTTGAATKIKDTDTRSIEREAAVKYVININKNTDGSYFHQKSTISEYGILVTQTTIEKVEPEAKFKELLGKQRDAAGAASLAKQQAQQAEYTKQKIIAEGETEKASQQVAQEKAQISVIVTAETERKKQEILVATKKAELDSANLDAQAIKVRADAEAYQKTKVMAADGALDKKLAAYVEVQKAYAEALKTTRVVPEIVMGGDGKNSSATNFMDMLQIKAARDLSLDLRAKGDTDK